MLESVSEALPESVSVSEPDAEGEEDEEEDALLPLDEESDEDSLL
jgi:hypothetical protein